MLTAHRYLSERGTVYSLGPDFASALAQVQEPKIERLVAAALLDPAAVDALPYPHQLLYPILKIVGKNPRISYYDVYDELKVDLGIPYLQGEVAPHRYKLTPRLRNRFSVAMHVLKGERFLNALREGTGRTSRKNPERYELSESGRELLERFPEGAPEAVTARLAPLPPQSLKHKLPQDVAEELAAREQAVQAAKEARAAERQARLATREQSHRVEPVPGASPALLARPSTAASAAPSVSSTQQAPVTLSPSAPVSAISETPAVAVSVEPSAALEVAAAQVREALKRYRVVFRREALAPALAGVSDERFRRIGFDLFLMRGYHVEPLDAQGVDGVATPASGDAERAFYLRALRLDSGTVSPQEVTRFFLAVHARGGQLVKETTGRVVCGGLLDDDIHLTARGNLAVRAGRFEAQHEPIQCLGHAVHAADNVFPILAGVALHEVENRTHLLRNRRDVIELPIAKARLVLGAVQAQTLLQRIQGNQVDVINGQNTADLLEGFLSQTVQGLFAGRGVIGVEGFDALAAQLRSQHRVKVENLFKVIVSQLIDIAQLALHTVNARKFLVGAHVHILT